MGNVIRAFISGKNSLLVCDSMITEQRKTSASVWSRFSTAHRSKVHCGPILLTGASGYVGGRLLTALLSQGYDVRCLARQPENLSHPSSDEFEAVAGDVLEFDSLAEAFRGIDTAFYLVHSMGSSGGFEEQDRLGAENFSKAAKQAGVRRIIYLGGLGRDDELSPHLASRQEVGRVLRESGVPTIELRASIIIGSGSLSFEMIRALVKRLPIMTTPRWVRSLTQPIAIEDVIAYCLAAIKLDIDTSAVYEIGGPEQVSYCDLMREYAKQRGLKRFIIPVPFLSPGLSGLWLGLVTPLYARVGRKLIDSVRHDTVVHDSRALRDFDIQPRDHRDAIRRALANEDEEFAQTRWSDAVSSSGEVRSWGGVKFGERLIDSRRKTVAVSPSRAFEPIQRLGGKTGWYYGNGLWRLRGWIDMLMGGVGMRRGRRHPTRVRVGDALDFWRVEAFEPDRLLRLRAEMKVPGRAWLQFEVEPSPSGQGATITQTAMFDPTGLSGRLYWYALWPIHQFVFGGMLRRIALAAERQS